MVDHLQGVINMMEAILKAGLGGTVKFFEASSCEIFGKGQGCSCDEDSAMRPQTPYGKAKLLAHLAVMQYRFATCVPFTKHSLHPRRMPCSLHHFALCLLHQHVP